MATLTVQKPTKNSGLNPVVFAAATGGGDVMPNDGQTLLVVKNGGGSPINVTITKAAATFDPGHKKLGPIPLSDLVVAVAAGAETVVGPLAPDLFNNASGQAPITYSGVTSVTVAALGFQHLA